MRLRILSVLLLLFSIAVRAQSPLDTLAMRAIMVNQLFPQEKVYLHFDNTSYYLGETMWFKAYVVGTADHTMHPQSRVLYVELVAPEGYVVEMKKYKLDNDLYLNENYENLNIVFCHVSDRNVSVGAHKQGCVVDVNQAYMGFGPMGFFETGTMPVSNVVDMLFKKHYPKDEMLKLINRNATFHHYVATNSCEEIMSLPQNDNRINLILEVMAYQIAKEIASHYVTLDGEIDAVILSGKIFSDKRFFKYLYQRIENLATIQSYPKDYTIDALIFNVLKIVNGKGKIKTYG